MMKHLLFSTSTLAALLLPGFSAITNVSETNLGADAEAMIETGFNEDSLSFSDRTHEHNGAAFEGDFLDVNGSTIIGLPPYLIGGDYVRFANNARENVDYEAVIQTDVLSEFYVLVDNRLDGPAGTTGSPNTSDPVLGGTLQWLIDGGWERVNTGLSPAGQPDYAGVDEGGNEVGAGLGLNQFYSIYKFPTIESSVTVSNPEISGCNMISVVVIPAPDVNEPISSFSTSPLVISEGETADLNWLISTSATSGEIDQEIGDILPLTTEGAGTVPVTPMTTTTYSLSVESPEGDESVQATVQVRLLANFTSDAVLIESGDPVTLSWSTRSDATVEISGVGAVETGDGSIVVNPTETTTYTLTSTFGDENESTEVQIFVQESGTLFALLDIGATGGTPEMGALTGAQLGGGAVGENGLDYPETTLTSETGEEFTLTMDSIDPEDFAVGGLDWRDRGDSSGEPLTALGEDLVKNNAGMIRVTLGGLAAGTYEILSFHYDPLASQAEDISILVTDANGTAVDTGVKGSAAQNPIINSINNTSANMVSHVAVFSIESNGNDDVILYFDARLGLDTEVPLNALKITRISGGGPRIVRIDVDPLAQTITLEFTSRPGGIYAIFASPDLENFPDGELEDSVEGTGYTTIFVETGVNPASIRRRFYRVERK